MAPTTQHDTAPAISGYDGLADRDLIRGLRQHSQAELDGIDAYERSHRARGPVLDKLRYLRGPQPLEGYDDMPAEEVLAALVDADLPTLHAVRGYESKLRAREDVLAGVNRLRERRRPTHASDAQNGDPAPARPASSHRIRDGAVSLGVAGLVVVAVVLAIISLLVGVIVVLSVVAPNALP